MIPLTLLPNDGGSRVKRDRLELLTTLIQAPGFDPLYRSDFISIPQHHPVYAWACQVEECERPRVQTARLCHRHSGEWRAADKAGTSRGEFLRTATPLTIRSNIDLGSCRVCPERSAEFITTRLCNRHHDRWNYHLADNGHDDFDLWLAKQESMPGYGICRTKVCPGLATSPLGLCDIHLQRYKRAGQPGGAKVPANWHLNLEPRGLPIPVICHNEAAFRRWCAEADPCYRSGTINLVGLAPLAKAEIQWGLHAHAQSRRYTSWDLTAVQRLANHCRTYRASSLADMDAHDYASLQLGANFHASVRMICRMIVDNLRLIYYSPADTKDAGFIETDHFGRRFKYAASTFDFTGVPQRWLRDLLWDHTADLLRSQNCPRSRGPVDNLRRACVELGSFLAVDAPEGGHAPNLLREDHAQRFVADQRHRERHGLPSLGMTLKDGESSTVTIVTRRGVFNAIRKLFQNALESGRAEELGLDRAFVIAFPPAGTDPKRSRNPFSDEVARALADEANLQVLAATYDPNDRGVRDTWETIVVTGRRCREVLDLRLDCIARYRGLPMLWHDQTKVGNYDEGIRIPETLYTRIDQRRATTITRFERRHGRLPTPAERTAMALFPTHIANINEDRSLSYGFFGRCFKSWTDQLQLPPSVAHQARHSLATNLLRAGASLTHIRRYLGQVSDRMAEHYTKVAHSDLEDVLHAVWVAGPGAPTPGELLSGDSAPLSRGEAMALALDLSRRSTPTEGGFCTFQPVVDGNACPWSLDCENCDKFVLSGADLLYWRRKQEQWRSIAERAPDDATADYLHQVFEPTAHAIAGLEKALAGLGLLDEALRLDLRRPQDYFNRIWSTNFRATDLAKLDTTNDGQDTELGEEQTA